MFSLKAGGGHLSVSAKYLPWKDDES